MNVIVVEGGVGGEEEGSVFEVGMERSFTGSREQGWIALLIRRGDGCGTSSYSLLYGLYKSKEEGEEE